MSADSVPSSTTNEYQKAINDCDQAITLNPNDAISFASRGFAYVNYKRIHSVIGYITPAQKMAELKKVA
jgi:regulator of sirC expression with transglutaminase-like and TPR domain